MVRTTPSNKYYNRGGCGCEEIKKKKTEKSELPYFVSSFSPSIWILKQTFMVRFLWDIRIWNKQKTETFAFKSELFGKLKYNFAIESAPW